MNSKQNLAVFSAAADSEHNISSKTTQKRTRQNLVSIFIVRTGTYLYGLGMFYIIDLPFFNFFETFIVHKSKIKMPSYKE